MQASAPASVLAAAAASQDPHTCPSSVYVCLGSEGSGGLTAKSSVSDQKAQDVKTAIFKEVTTPITYVTSQVDVGFQRLSFSKTDPTLLPAQILGDCKTQLVKLEPVLQRHMESLSVIVEDDKIPTLMQDIAASLYTMRTLNRQIERIGRFCNKKHYTDAVNLLRQVETDCVKYSSTYNQNLCERIDTLAAEWTSFKASFASLNKEVDQVVPDKPEEVKAAHHLRQELVKIQIQASGLFLSSCTKLISLALSAPLPRTEKLLRPQTMQQDVVQYIATLRQKLQSDPQSKEQTLSKIQIEGATVLSDNVIKQQAAKFDKALPGSYYPIAQGWATYLYDARHSSPAAKKLEPVAKAMLLLLQDIDIRAKAVLAGDLTPTSGKNTLIDECRWYRDLCVKLEADLTKTVDDFHNMLPDSYVVQFENYAAGLREKLADIRRSLHYLFKLCSQQHEGVAKATAAMRTYLCLPKQEIDERSSLQAMENLYIAASHVQALLGSTPKTSFKKDQEKLLTMINDTTVRKGPKALAPVGLEKDVWQVLTTKESLEKLETEQEKQARNTAKASSLQELPIALRSYIEKKIYAFLYLPKKAADDFELEFLLYILNSDDSNKALFRASLNNNEQFRCMIDAYEALDTVKSRRLPQEFLAKAADICSSLSNVGKGSFLDYAQAVLAFDAFEILRTRETRKLSVNQAPLDAFRTFIVDWFQNVSKKHDFVFVSDKHRLKNLEVIEGMENFSEIIKKDQSGYTLQERCALFMRALACARWGDAKQSHPVESARKIIRVYVEDDTILAEMFAYNTHLKELFFEYTLHNAHMSQLDLILPKERDLFIQGPITQFFQTKKRPDYDDPRIELAIFNLVWAEQGPPGTAAAAPITALGKKLWGEAAFKRWYWSIYEWGLHMPQLAV